MDTSKFDPDSLSLDNIPHANTSHSGRELAINLATVENLSVRQLASSFDGYTGLFMVGTAQAIADQMGKWLLERGCDASNIMFTYPPMGLDYFVDQVVPELQHRGIF